MARKFRRQDYYFGATEADHKGKKPLDLTLLTHVINGAEPTPKLPQVSVTSVQVLHTLAFMHAFANLW
jgi:hypothetical protein